MIANQQAAEAAQAQAEDVDFIETQDAWDDDETVAKFMLFQKIPDASISHIAKLSTVARMWTALTFEFTN